MSYSDQDIAKSIRAGGIAAVAAKARASSNVPIMDIDKLDENDFGFMDILNTDGIVAKTTAEKIVKKRTTKKEEEVAKKSEENSKEEEKLTEIAAKIEKNRENLLAIRTKRLEKIKKGGMLSNLGSIGLVGMISPETAALMAVTSVPFKKVDSIRENRLNKSIEKLSASKSSEEKLSDLPDVLNVPSETTISDPNNALERIYGKQEETVSKLDKIESVLYAQRDIEKAILTKHDQQEDKDIEKVREDSLQKAKQKISENKKEKKDEKHGLSLDGVFGFLSKFNVAGLAAMLGIPALSTAVGSITASLSGLGGAIAGVSSGLTGLGLGLARALLPGGAIIAAVISALNSPTMSAEYEEETLRQLEDESNADPLGFQLRNFENMVRQGLDSTPSQNRQAYLEDVISSYRNRGGLYDRLHAEGRGEEGRSILDGIANDYRLSLSQRTFTPRTGATPLETILGTPSLGSIAARYESRGDVSTISTGAGDPGGVSYGSYQLSSNAGTVNDWMRNEGSVLANEYGLTSLTPGTREFNQAYSRMAAEKPVELHESQHEYIRRTHYEPVLAAAQSRGFDTNNPAIAEALWSQSVQHSFSGNRVILNNASSEGSVSDQLRSLQQSRSSYVSGLSSLSERMRGNILSRYENEYSDLQEIARQPVRANVIERGTAELMNAERTASSAPIIIDNSHISSGGGRSSNTSVTNITGGQADAGIRRVLDRFYTQGAVR